MPDALAALAASAALAVSDIPFDGPISEARVIKLGDEFLVNPTPAQMAEASLDLIVAGSADNIMMVEGESKEVSEEDMLRRDQRWHMKPAKIQCQAQVELAAEVGATVKREFDHEPSDAELEAKIRAHCYDACYEIAKKGSANKTERSEGFDAIKESFLATYTEEEREELNSFLKKIFPRRAERRSKKLRTRY